MKRKRNEVFFLVHLFGIDEDGWPRDPDPSVVEEEKRRRELDESWEKQQAEEAEKRGPTGIFRGGEDEAEEEGAEEQAEEQPEEEDQDAETKNVMSFLIIFFVSGKSRQFELHVN